MRALQSPIVCGIVAFLLTAAALVVYIHTRFGLDVPPSATGDEPSYDSIGWQIASGRGFSEDFRVPEFRQPYDAQLAQFPRRMSLPETTPGTVTYRPPLFPTIVASLHRICGRQFFATRLWNIAMVSATAGLLVWFVHRQAGAVSALLAFLMFVAADDRPRLYARAILTEATAMFLGAVIAIALWRLAKVRRLGAAAVAGLCAGLAALNRSATAVGLPLITVAMFVLLTFRRREDGESDSSLVRPVWLAAAFFGIAVAVLSPWAVRNIVVLQAFMPLGAQGMMEMPAGFSDQAWQHYGIWQPVTRGADIESELAVRTRPEQERFLAERGQAAASDWIASHPEKAVALAFMKIGNEYRPRGAVQWMIAVLALVGIVHTRRCGFTLVFGVLHITNMAVIASTWSVEGRFVVPLLWSIHVWAALGIAALLRYWNLTSDVASRTERAADSELV